MVNLLVTYNLDLGRGICRTCKVLVLLVLLLLGVRQEVVAQQHVIPLSEDERDNMVVAVDNILLTEADSTHLGFSMSFAMLGNRLPRQQRVYIIPQLMMGDDTANFPAIEILGRWAYYHDIRMPQDTLNIPDTLQYRDSEMTTYQVYQQKVTRADWMGVALLRLLVLRVDGCGNEVCRQERVLRVPTPIYNVHQKEGNTQEEILHLQGRAYVSFPVNRTEVLPDFRNNQYELDRLRHTIDSVCKDSTIEIMHIQIKGFASPEGSWESNDRLARERTSSLTRYIIEKTAVSPVLFRTASEPEDWEGLRIFVDTTSLLTHKKQILELIDRDMDPDDKLKQIAIDYTADFRILLKEAFPLLRHTDYQIDYQLKKIEKEEDEVHVDTLYRLVTDDVKGSLVSTQRRFKGYKPAFALKTNLLYDLALAPNIEVEVPFGRDRRWSVMVEYLNPWWRLDKLNYAYEIQEAGVELRRWMMPRCDGSRPWLSGSFLGLYVASAKYDLEYNGVGDQGEIWSAGFTFGYSWPLNKRLNLELSASAGPVYGERRHYNAEFESSHLIYKSTKNMQYFGPTKVKLSLVWIIPAQDKKKGGAK